MGSEDISLLRELCYIANKRNAINTRRSKARWRKSYWQKAIKIVEAFKGENSESRKLDFQILHFHKDRDVSLLEKRRNEISISMHATRQSWLNEHRSKPNKWINMGSMKLRALALKAEADYAKAKYDTMILSEKTTKRVKNILKALDCGLSYDNGYVVGVTKRGAMYKSDAYLAMDRGEIEEYAKEFELNKAVDDLLRK